ncbi:hypothetical protein Tsp_09633 [Trichinella spiralis]|uniref:hypothetical protein n=1 Tax=Trichinella spiralis TaxID=6334 RepID=UPI0001EFF045|nr:hypothetical protein Tsp_09633 [Trichinella spiralis]
MHVYVRGIILERRAGLKCASSRPADVCMCGCFSEILNCPGGQTLRRIVWVCTINLVVGNESFAESSNFVPNKYGFAFVGMQRSKLLIRSSNFSTTTAYPRWQN